MLKWAKARRSKNNTRGAPAEIPSETAAGDDEPDELQVALLRYRQAKAEAEELKLEKERGRLVDRDRVEAVLRARCAELKRVLLKRLPRSMASRVLGMTSERQIETLIRAMLAEVLEDFVRSQGLHDLIEEGESAA